VLISRYEDPYELGMCLRWGLARVGRTKNGQVVKGAGLLDWDWYINFRDGEQGKQHFVYSQKRLSDQPFSFEALFLSFLSFFLALISSVLPRPVSFFVIIAKTGLPSFDRMIGRLSSSSSCASSCKCAKT
jgi:hypothetical protein